MIHRLRLLVTGICLALLTGPAAAQIPDEFSNLEVLPKEIGRAELIGIMRGYAGALGVRCIHCHVGEDPNDLDSVDFVSDERETKRVARSMMKMVQQINESLLPATGRKEAIEVECRTCHSGLARPQALTALLSETIEEEGTEPAIARYRELREEYHGRGAYDFGPNAVNSVAEGVARGKGDLTTAAALIRMNLEYHPDHAYTHFLLANLLAMSGDGAGAVASAERAVELEPGNVHYERGLARFRGAEEEGRP